MDKFLSISQLDPSKVEKIFSRAEEFKRGKIEAKYSGHWLLMFLEPSTRTRLSFEKALKMLGFETYLFTPESSSMKKGETLRDTVLTLKAQGFEGIVIRTPVNGHFREIEDIDIRAINAGEGTNEHPTQALLEAFTLREIYGRLEGLKVVYIGDTKYSRVFRSGLKLFKMLGAKVGICGPRSLRPFDAELLNLDAEFESVEEALKWCDAAVFLRIQKERQKEQLITSERDYFKLFGLTPERAKYLRENGKYYLHPGPVNRNVEIASPEIYGKNSLILKQVENGVYIRAAVIDFLYAF